ncbi:MAG: EFR1 family ferrodoxin [Muribaculaceae bacterium]|nr:EFR1 family ferrodoxin [Muribaculaceae bacterium]
MVIYFSGTGNSTFVATTIANFLNEKLQFLPTIEVNEMNLSEEERIIFVFPVYSWGVPPLVIRFISEIGEEKWERVKEKGIRVDCVMTCGDEVGLAPEMLQKSFRKFGITLDSVWSVIMPNNYVLLPGFNVDSKSIESKKLKACEGRILEISQAISRGERRVDVVRGSIPWLKTKLVFPLFKKWGIFPNKWHYTNACIGCGQCAKICPMLNVSMIENHPMWGKKCCSCLGCYHICPVHAVEYSNETKRKGQYIFPLKEIATKNFHKVK